jgi:Ser/Thr protein kinase RdoA (MazF antagonist)
MSAIPSIWVDSQQELIRLVIEDRRVEYGLALRTSDPTRVIASGPARVQKNSVLFEYAITVLQKPMSIVAKVPRRSKAHDNVNPGTIANAIEKSRTEWRELSKAYPHFAALTGGLGVVRPVGYIESCYALLVKKASGCELAKIMGTDVRAETGALARTGRWLSIFHTELHELSNRQWTPAWYAACLEERKARFISQGAPRRLWEPLFAHVLAHAERTPSQPVPRSMLHGDFRLRHIWAASDGIEILDFGNAHQGDCYTDVATLVVELMMLQLGRPIGARRRMETHTGAFLEAYFGAEPPPVFWFYVVDRLFKKWGRWLVRWNTPAKAAWLPGMMQRCVRLLHGTSVTNDLYISRWFSSQILEALARADQA